ncbi:MAG TPA: helix-turn-helix transcriptional regulator [Verrucomicrobiae bacterium]|nr:helix-turn-helix transcriptional regulator [Verrucomicrobiae bacterium]
MELAKEIQRRMKALNMTQQDLSRLSGVPQSRISDAFQERTFGATEATLNKLLAALKASVKWGQVEGYPKHKAKHVPPARKPKQQP